jgi:hypothetical protein
MRWAGHVKESEVGRACSTYGKNNGGKARRKKTTRKTKIYVTG